MLFESWFYFVIGTIPESIAIVALGTAIVKEKFSFKKMVLAGLILSLIGLLMQFSPIGYGVHLPLGIISTILVFNIFLKIKILRSATAALSSFVVLVLIEAVTVFVMLRLLGLSEEIFTKGTELQIFLISIPPLLLLITVTIFMQWMFRAKYGRDKNAHL